MPAHNGHITGMVTRRGIELLVRGLVLFVDNNQPDPREWCEHCGTRPNDDFEFSSACTAPDVAALSGRHMAVDNSDVMCDTASPGITGSGNVRGGGAITCSTCGNCPF